ncbi:hypothetical protein QR680_009136 [Steinernema hermaphroditum]|uniref:Thioredoxin domain-containing protein n=1 Tax=Steinernema hermaphroditum TaxID=289476 RepID=A0AA39IKH2_9BILA|nr:hypothetical protein QR680_009136 [Steinernema hermaphroditum]
MWTSILLLLLAVGVDRSSATKVHSNVIDLNDRFLEVKDKGMWFVKFYAPWCAHCKRLTPIWEHVGHALADRESPVRLAKLDCTRYPSVAQTLKVNAYPTLIFFRDGKQIHYEGERRKESLVDFVVKTSGPVVDTIDSPAKFAEQRKTSVNDPLFVFVESPEEGDKAQSEDLFSQYEEAANSFFTGNRFLKTAKIAQLPSSVVLPSRPGVVVFKDNVHYVYNSEKEPNLTAWINAERFPLIPAVSGANIHDLGTSLDKLLVLAVLSFVDRLNTSSEVGQFYALAREAATQMRKNVELQGHFQFGWLDGNQIANSIVLGDMPLPSVLVFNYTSYEYFLSDDSPQQMTSQSLLTFLETINSTQSLGGRSLTQRVRRMVYEVTTNVYEMFVNQPILTSCLFGVPVAFLSIITYSICSSDFSVDRESIYPEDEEFSDPEQEGLLDDDHEKAE